MTDLSKLTIVVVDDDKVSLSFAVALLKKIGISSVFTERDGLSGLISTIINKADIVICDIYMPLYSGVDFVSFMNNLGKTTPIILLTSSKASVIDDFHLKYSGTITLTQKPVTPEILVFELEKCLGDC